jgi:MoxR-like ATPase
MPFSADDAALAIKTMNEEGTADIPYTTRDELEATFNRITAENQMLVSNVMKLHGLNQIGDPDLGTDEGAKAVVDAVRSYQADPVAYSDALFQEASQAEPQQASTTPSPQNDLMAAPAPAISLSQAISPPAVHQPVASIRFIKRPAQALFEGISPTYHNELIPTAVWESPKPVIGESDPDFQFNGYAMTIMALAIEERKNVIATGDPGCGKTEFFKQFGARVNLPVKKIPFDGNLTRSEIIGSFRQVATPTGSETPFVLGLIPRLIQQPGIIILDEIDQADPDIMYMLHPVFEGEGLTIQEEGGTFIPRHEHCYIVATANTKGRGSDNGLTHARFEMSEATRDRFPYWLNFTFMQEAQEAATIMKKTGLDLKLSEKLVQVAGLIRTAYKNGSVSQTCSLRQMLDVVPAYRRFAALGDDKALAMGINTVMIGRANQDDADGMREWVKQTLAVDLEKLEQ